MEETLTIGPSTSRPLTLVTDRSTFHFVARFDPDGTPAWVVPLMGEGFLHFGRMAASPLTTVLFGDKHAGDVTFGIGGPTITDSGAVIVRIGP